MWGECPHVGTCWYFETNKNHMMAFFHGAVFYFSWVGQGVRPQIFRYRQDKWWNKSFPSTWRRNEEIHILLFQVQVSITNRVKNVKLCEWLTTGQGRGHYGPGAPRGVASRVGCGMNALDLHPHRAERQPRPHPRRRHQSCFQIDKFVLSAPEPRRVYYINLCELQVPYPFFPTYGEIWYKWVFTLCVDQYRALSYTER